MRVSYLRLWARFFFDLPHAKVVIRAACLWPCVLGLLLPADGARAALTIDITQGVEGALPIAIVPFRTEAQAAPPEDIDAIIAGDLKSSGRFAPLPEKDLVARPHEGAEINFRDWRLLGSENLVVGSTRAGGAGQYAVQFQLFDVFRGEQLEGYSFSSKAQDLRRVGHQISDMIYEKLTGERGAFNTRIAYVTASNAGTGSRDYALQIADADGRHPQTILRSKEPLLSPAWSPDGTRLAYLSFENDRPQIYVQETASGRRGLVASYPGLNGAPAWSPDGRQLALTLSKDGNAEIYVLNLASKALQRLTNNPAIDTEPAWSPDGKTMVFTSDRGGRPQIYRMSAVGGGNAERVTFEGDYNAGGAFSPDGKRLAMVQGNKNAYHIAVMDLQSGAVKALTQTALDESPSFSPNGNMIIYATSDKGRNVLARVSVDGRARQRLVLQEGDVREPAWSPFGRKIDIQL